MVIETAESKFALNVVQKLRDEEYEALWAGGCVRDLLLSIQPADYDVATSATPKQVRKLFGYQNTVAVGLVFGVVIVRDPDSGQQIEVATFRTESSYSDGRRPDSVEFSTPERDAQRRDFTINGMFYDPIAHEVIDYVGGQQDLERRIIRAIGAAEDRIGEDKLRMLRAVRFAARFGFEIDGETRLAVINNAKDLSIISGERIAVEFQKTLATQLSGWAVQEWQELGLLTQILPVFSEVPCPQVIEKAKESLSQMQACGWRGKAASLLFNLGAASAGSVSKTVSLVKSRLKLANDDAKAIKFALESLERLQQAPLLAWSELQPLLISQWIQDAVDLLHASKDWSNARDYIEEKLRQSPENLNPLPLISGNDLLDLGIRPGPQIKQLLEQVRVLQLDGKLASQQAALEYARERLAVP